MPSTRVNTARGKPASSASLAKYKRIVLKLSGEALHARLARHRLYVQIIGMVSIFVTAIWGMNQNLNLGPLGG